MSEARPPDAARPVSGVNPFASGDAPTRSLNRVWLMELPGVPVEEGLLGRRAGDVLSAEAVRKLIRAAPLPALPPTPDLLRQFDACFDDAHTRRTALAVADVVGRRLGALLLMLQRGDPANRAARPEWNDTHWAYWAAVERVVIGGGLMSGRLGEAAVAEARAFLAAAGCGLIVERFPFGAAIALVGLARHAPDDAARMLLFDFGHTSVKRGLATYRGGTVTSLMIRPPLPTPCEDGWPANAGPDAARARWERMAAAIAAEWVELVPPNGAERTAIGLCLASHLQDGHPIARDRGCYSVLGDLAPHLLTFLRGDLAARLGRFRSLTLLHDGLAAASTRTGEPRTVVLTLGTSIGTGYTPVGERLRSISANLMVRHSESPRF
jgi:hypothetical protein